MRGGLTLTLCVLGLLAGCFSERTDFVDGELACSVGTRRCPPGFTCAPDGKCYRSAQPPDAPLGDGGPCAEGTLACRDRDVMRCEGGELVFQATCDVACSNGFCLACEPDALRCNGSRRQQCTPTGGWADLPTCPAATPQCENGLCVPACSPVGGRRCSAGGDAIQECEAAGQFRDVAECAFVCLPDDPPRCGGVCRPDTQQCGEDETPETCSATGEWIDGAPCAGICDNGACSGECRPSSTRCAGPTTVQTCGMTATWGTATPCAFVCDEATGKCGGECTPDARRCNGTRAEVCDTTGHWQLDRDCGLLPCTGGSCTPCVNDTTQCNADIPQRCVDGDWVDQRDSACPFLCDPTAGCVGECVPGSELCAPGDVHRVCGTDALYDDETCDFVCLDGDCAGVCDPGRLRCNGDASQRCTSLGQWGTGMSCAFGCDVATGECQACVPEPLDETCKDAGCGDKVNNCGEVVTCPACTGPGESCGGGGTDGFCGCTAEAAAVTCRDGDRCAPTENNCGQLVECPDACVAPESCGGGAVAGECGCTPLARDVACAGRVCGSVSDGCGGTLSCEDMPCPTGCDDTTGQCCAPESEACAGKCGPIDVGTCHYECGIASCVSPETCDTDTNLCVCVLPDPCGARCGPFDDACGKHWECAPCPGDAATAAQRDAGVID